MRCYLLTLIDVPGPDVDLTDDAATFALIVRAMLTPDDTIKGFWACPVLDEPEVKPNVQGSERMN